MRFLSFMVLLVFISPAIALPAQSNCVQLGADGNCAIYGALTIDNSSSLGVFDPYWDRGQWIWEGPPSNNPPLLKHKTVNDCYVDGDMPGEVHTDFRITRGKKKLFGSLYEVIRTYDEKNILSEVYYVKGEINRVLTVFVGKGANKCIAKAEEILRRYELHQTKQMQSNAQHNAPVGTSAFLISRESIETSKPEKVAVTSIKAADLGAKIVAFSSSVGIATFLRQLENAGATNVRLLEIKPITVCGRRVTRAEFQIDGDTSHLIEVNSSMEQLDLLLGGINKEAQCISSVHM